MQFSTKKDEKEIFPSHLFIPSRVKNPTYKGETEMLSSHFAIPSWLLNKQSLVLIHGLKKPFYNK